VAVGNAVASQVLAEGTQNGAGMMAHPVMYLIATMIGAMASAIALPANVR
jgi:hypothetical protein